MFTCHVTPLVESRLRNGRKKRKTNQQRAIVNLVPMQSIRRQISRRNVSKTCQRLAQLRVAYAFRVNHRNYNILFEFLRTLHKTKQKKLFSSFNFQPYYPVYKRSQTNHVSWLLSYHTPLRVVHIAIAASPALLLSILSGGRSNTHGSRQFNLQKGSLLTFNNNNIIFNFLYSIA